METQIWWYCLLLLLLLMDATVRSLGGWENMRVRYMCTQQVVSMHRIIFCMYKRRAIVYSNNQNIQTIIIIACCFSSLSLWVESTFVYTKINVFLSAKNEDEKVNGALIFHYFPFLLALPGTIVHWHTSNTFFHNWALITFYYTFNL